MNFAAKTPPRAFTVGHPDSPLTLYDCGSVQLEPDQQITFVTANGNESDVTRKEWGYYITPSLNRRLLLHSLRGALVKSYDGTFFVWLVEKGREAEMNTYCRDNGIKLVCWLDTDALSRIETMFSPESSGRACCPCGANSLVQVFHLEQPPEGEVGFSVTAGRDYLRDILRCAVCGHYVSRHDMLPDEFYDQGYVNGTYGDDNGIAKAYQRIMGLPDASSDNAARVARVSRFALERRNWKSDRKSSLLDVGSGLCVFLARMKELGWRGTALDPDPRSVAHARDTVGVPAVEGNFSEASDLGRFDVVSFNKVLEHVVDPVAMLARAARFLEPRGFVYVEVPDGEAAAELGPGREEFFIEHWHIYSPASLALSAQKAGFLVEEIERVREPSSKYTLRAFLAVHGENQIASR